MRIINYPSNIEMPRRSARRISKRRGSKRSGSKRRMRGGWRMLSPASINDTSMAGPMNMSLKQGGEYSDLHEGQHGGGAIVGAPAFQSETLPGSMVEAARTGGTLQAFSEIQGMKDQGGGGRRRRRSRRSRRSRRKQYGGQGENTEEENSNNSMSGGRRRRYRKSRRQGGGANIHPADVSSPDMLLSGNSAKAAEGAMNPEWQLAKNPAAFAPN